MKIDFNYETTLDIRESDYIDWISRVLNFHKTRLGQLSYVFCKDDYLLEINKKYLDHDTYTDIITFDYSVQGEISGDVFISLERVKENSKKFEVDFHEELRRVMVHGVLHLLGFSDGTDEQKSAMREEENKMMELFHVEQ
ncbi:rRNA maturation RNase YbeY [uncultured Croceitalea sp.]|uniref:rRNA maturation RNase YbeY n=1 Tax=uncultured Croceitalea sp. TaxID=1798908 RepID=UPI0033056A62